MFKVKAEEKKYRLKEMARKLGERGENYMKRVKGEQLKELRGNIKCHKQFQQEEQPSDLMLRASLFILGRTAPERVLMHMSVYDSLNERGMRK